MPFPVDYGCENIFIKYTDNLICLECKYEADSLADRVQEPGPRS